MAEEIVDNEVDVPIHRVDLIMFEDNVTPVKEMFTAEMQRMDEEMNKLSSNLMRFYSQSSTLHAETVSDNESLERQSPSKRLANWESLVSSPLIEGEGENKTLNLRFNVRHFDPTKITVKVQNEKLVVSAAHEETSANSSVLREFYREFKLPKGVDPTSVNSTLSKDGVLTVQAPLQQLAITDKVT